MNSGEKIKFGWIIIGISFIISIVVVGAVTPDIEVVETCEAEFLQTGSETERCEEVRADDELSDTLIGVVCVLPSGVGFILIGLGKYGPDSQDNSNVIIQNPPYMMPAQPTYAPPIQQQTSQNDLDVQLKAQKMQGVESLCAEGRYMEAALLAEQAGEYSYADKLRRQAEDRLRISHKPQSNNEDTYLAYLTSALADGFISVEEDKLLETQRNLLGVTWDVHCQMLLTAGYSHEHLKLLQNAKSKEDSGRFIESASLYEAAGNFDKAQMLRLKASMLENNQSNVVYNISDSAVSGNIGANDLNDLL